jgi:DNA replication licensing factor MCM6
MYSLAFAAWFHWPHSPAQSTSEREGIINIRPDEDESPEKVLEGYSEAHEQELRDMAGRGPGLFDDLARSMCPSVYGCEAVKKAVLLMLLGGVHKKTQEVRRSAG